MMNMSCEEESMEMSGHLASENAVEEECSVQYEGVGFEPETWCAWKESFYACDFASSSTFCSSKQTDSSASRTVDTEVEHSDVVVELLDIPLNDNHGKDAATSCDVECAMSKFISNSESDSWFWDDAMCDSNSGPATDWEADFSESIDDWMLDAEMIALGGIPDSEMKIANPS